MYLESVAEESFLKEYRIDPTFDQYLAWRRRNIGGTVVSYFAEYASLCYLTPAEEKQVTRIRELCNDWMMLENDLTSVKKDDSNWNYFSFTGLERGKQDLLHVYEELAMEREKSQRFPHLTTWYDRVICIFKGVAEFHQNASRWH